MPKYGQCYSLVGGPDVYALGQLDGGQPGELIASDHLNDLLKYHLLQRPT